jgi:hypothetical protein
MLYELRHYGIDASQWEGYREWAGQFAFPILFELFSFRLVGFWEAVTSGELDKGLTDVYWILTRESEKEIRERRAALRGPEAYRVVIAASTNPETGERQFHRRERSTLLRSWPISSMQ